MIVEQRKAHKPRIIGVTALLTCVHCGVALPINYVCPWCRWDQVFTEDRTEVLEICIPCPIHAEV